MPIIASFGAASKGGFGRGGKKQYMVSYLVVAGGGGGAGKVSPGPWENGGAGGGGGVRDLGPKSFPVFLGDSYPITVGSGGAGGNPWDGANGGYSSFSTIESTGGGSGGPSPTTCQPSANDPPVARDGKNGGSGGGASREGAGGTGNWTRCCGPAVSPPQGNPGASTGHSGSPGAPVGGGGGFGGGSSSSSGGPGGTSPVYPGTYAAGGSGGSTSSGGANTADGGGGTPGSTGGSGGSGRIVIVRATACSCTTSGCNSTCGSCTIHLFNAPGTYVA